MELAVRDSLRQLAAGGQMAWGRGLRVASRTLITLPTLFALL